MSPFAHWEDVRSVSVLLRDVDTGESQDGRKIGARIVFSRVPGLTMEGMRRLVNCHLARAEVIGYEKAERDMPYCPLMLSGVSATVRMEGDQVAVDVVSRDSEIIGEILRRATALKSGRDSPG